MEGNVDEMDTASHVEEAPCSEAVGDGGGADADVNADANANANDGSLRGGTVGSDSDVVLVNAQPPQATEMHVVDSDQADTEGAAEAEPVNEWASTRRSGGGRRRAQHAARTPTTEASIPATSDTNSRRRVNTAGNEADSAATSGNTSGYYTHSEEGSNVEMRSSEDAVVSVSDQSVRSLEDSEAEGEITENDSRREEEMTATNKRVQEDGEMVEAEEEGALSVGSSSPSLVSSASVTPPESPVTARSRSASSEFSSTTSLQMVLTSEPDPPETLPEVQQREREEEPVGHQEPVQKLNEQERKRPLLVIESPPSVSSFSPPKSPTRTMRPPRLAAAQQTGWMRYATEEGAEYYYNAHTQQSQWTRPPTLLSPTNDVSGSSSSSLDQLFEAAARSDETSHLDEILGHAEIDINACNDAGLTALHIAVQHGNARGAAILLEYGAHVDALPDLHFGRDVALSVGPYPSEPPLLLACRANHASLVRLLTRKGASIYTRDADSNSLLHIAVRCWSDDALQALLEVDSMAAIVNLRNAEDETPLHVAARHGNALAVGILLSAGASTDTEDAQGRTPLVVSIMENRVDCAQLLQTAESAVLEGQNGDEVDRSIMTADQSAPTPATVLYHIDHESVDNDDANLESLCHYLLRQLSLGEANDELTAFMYQYIQGTQNRIAQLTTNVKNAHSKDDNMALQLEIMSNNHAATCADLAKEREENGRLTRDLQVKELELEAAQAAHDSLASRASILESIARVSQDKLRRERAEQTRHATYWNQVIDASLRENSELLKSVRSLQDRWNTYTQDSKAGATPTDQHVLQEHSSEHMNNISPNALHTDGYLQDDHNANTLNAASSYVGANIQQQQYDDDSFGGFTFAYHNSSNPAELTVPNASSYDEVTAPYPKGHVYDAYGYYEADPGDKEEEHEAEEEVADERPISAERVDAVWNRFFENVGRSTEDNIRVGDGSVKTVASPLHRLPPNLPPASSVFDAVRKNSISRLHELVLRGISPNTRDVGERGTPIHLACELGDIEAVMLLSEFGGDLELRDENENTPLIVACSQGHCACTKFLLQSAVNLDVVNIHGDTALHAAAWDTSFECISMLLEYGIDPKARNKKGLTALENVKMRSPLRHRLDELPSTHPLRKTLEILEDAERIDDRKDSNATTTTITQPVVPTPATSQNASATGKESESWGRWILGSVFRSRQQPSTVSTTDETEYAHDEEEMASASDGETEDTHEMPNNDADNHSDTENDDRYERIYSDLHVPLELEEELKRAHPHDMPTNESFPLPPPEVLEALEKHRQSALSPQSVGRGIPTAGGGGGRNTRFASPSAMTAATTKKSASSMPAPTHIRSRYVDTFNGGFE